MQLHVFLQIAEICLGFITLVTTVLFLSCVQLHVVLHSATLCEGFVALVTGLGIVACDTSWWQQTLHVFLHL